MPSTSDDDATERSVLRAGLLLAGLVVVSLAVTATAVTGTLPGLGGDADEVAGAELASFETDAPRCGTHRSSNHSTSVRPDDGGYRLHINETLPVASRNSTLSADVETVGEGRYHLDVARTPGTRSTECYLEARFNATVELPRRGDYTLVFTIDRQYQELLYGGPGSAGASASNRVARPPSMNGSEWSAALNASDAYHADRTDGSTAGGEATGSDGTSGDRAGGSAGSSG